MTMSPISDPGPELISNGFIGHWAVSPEIFDDVRLADEADIHYGLCGPSDESELKPSKVQW